MVGSSGSPVSLCGSNLVIDGSGKRATIGGVLIINDRPFGLTVAHAFGHNDKVTVAESNTVVRFYDSSGDEESDCGCSDDCFNNCPAEKDLTPLPKKSATGGHADPAAREKQTAAFSAAASSNDQGIPWN